MYFSLTWKVFWWLDTKCCVDAKEGKKIVCWVRGGQSLQSLQWTNMKAVFQCQSSVICLFVCFYSILSSKSFGCCWWRLLTAGSIAVGDDHQEQVKMLIAMIIPKKRWFLRALSYCFFLVEIWVSADLFWWWCSINMQWRCKQKPWFERGFGTILVKGFATIFRNIWSINTLQQQLKRAGTKLFERLMNDFVVRNSVAWEMVFCNRVLMRMCLCLNYKVV